MNINLVKEDELPSTRANTTDLFLRCKCGNLPYKYTIVRYSGDTYFEVFCSCGKTLRGNSTFAAFLSEWNNIISLE